MIRTVFLALTIAFGLALPAAAQTVRVIAGEHDDFTRLVLRMPAEMAYTLSGSDPKRILKFGQQSFSFDLQTVFDKIPRTRLRAIEALPDQTGLSLDLACDCVIDTFWYGARYLVLDIREEGRPPEPESPQAAQNATVGPRLAPIGSTAISPTASRLVQNAFAIPAPAPSDGDEAEEVKEAETQSSEEPSTIGQAPEVVEPAVSPSQEAARRAREALTSQLARAASQGLLSPQEHPLHVQEQHEEGLPQAEETMDDGKWTEDLPSSPQENLNVTAHSSVDRDFAEVIESLGARSEPKCLYATYVDVPAWKGEGEFSDQIGPLRAAIYDDRGMILPDAVEALAKFYIYYGFGAEAREALSNLETPSRQAKILHEMSDILMRGYGNPVGVFAKAYDCETSISMWAVLSNPVIPPDTIVDENAILRSFVALPPHLRQYLGPQLANRFIAKGDTKTANEFLKQTRRGAKDDNIHAAYADAEIKLVEGDPLAAEEKLAEVVSENTDISVEALIKLIDTRLERDQVISHETAQLASAYLYENRGTAWEADLRRAAILSHAASGAVDESFEELEDLREQSETDRYLSVKSDLMNILSDEDRVGTAPFLKHAIAESVRRPQTLEPAVGDRVATRLLDLGFADVSERYIPSLSSATSRERHLLRARAALDLSRPRQAEAELVGLHGEDVNALRARAREMAGDFGQAEELYSSLDETEEARRAAWLAEDWERVQSIGESPADAAAAALFKAEGASDVAVPDLSSAEALSATRSLLSNAEDTRRNVEDLLTQMPPVLQDAD